MPDPTAAVRLVKLTKQFGSGRGIDRVDLAVASGQVFGFLGPRERAEWPNVEPVEADTCRDHRAAASVRSSSMSAPLAPFWI